MPKIEVRCYATLRDKLPKDAIDGVYTYETFHSNIQGIVEELGLPTEELHLIMKNGSRVSLDEPVNNGDRIGFFPPIGGG